MKILLLATHFGNEHEVRRFIAHVGGLSRPASLSIELVVADNSGDWSGSRTLPDWARVVKCPGNRGYANGCEFALGQAATRDSADWVFVANTDLTLAADFFLALMDRKFDEITGVLAPSVTRADGLIQNPHFRSRPSGRRMMSYLVAYRFGIALAAMEAVSKWKQRLRGGRFVEPATGTAVACNIYAAHGSLFGLSRSFLDRGGRIGYESFLYGEEIHIAEQARLLKLCVRYEPALVVTHHAKAVTGKQHVQQRRRWKYESMRYLFRTYFQPSVRVQ